MLQLEFNFEAPRGKLRGLRSLITFQSTTLRSTKIVDASPNLEGIVALLNKNYFDNGVEVSIAWARKVRGRGRRHIRLGSYYFKNRTIRIHPVLGLSWVPREVLEAVVFHEMCHAAIPSEKVSSRLRRHHGPQFKQKEQSFLHYLFAKQWIRENLPRLLKVRF